MLPLVPISYSSCTVLGSIMGAITGSCLGLIVLCELRFDPLHGLHCIVGSCWSPFWSRHGNPLRLNYQFMEFLQSDIPYPVVYYLITNHRIVT